ncbi:hypothetical protein OIDMADRAFT_128335, partial [Oidiodendron maius Zn]
LILAEFIYNNSTYSLTSISLFFTIYRMNPEIYLNIKDTIIGEEAVIVYKRVYIISNEYNILNKH